MACPWVGRRRRTPTELKSTSDQNGDLTGLWYSWTTCQSRAQGICPWITGRWWFRHRSMAGVTSGSPAIGAWTNEPGGQMQRSLTEQFCADKASVSGEHLGRLAGFKNWKRGGCWVNVLCDLDGSRRYAVPQRVLTGQHVERPPSVTSPPASPGGPPAKIRTGDVSPSGLEWGWVCRLLEMGQDPDRVYHMLVNRAADRRGEDVERYARRTVEKALERVRKSL